MNDSSIYSFALAWAIIQVGAGILIGRQHRKIEVAKLKAANATLKALLGWTAERQGPITRAKRVPLEQSWRNFRAE